MPKTKKLAKRNGRPVKITSGKFLDVFKSMIKKAENEFSPEFIALTDEDLVYLINQRLPKKDQIVQRSFERYKARINDPDIPEPIKEFGRLYKAILLNQKRFLMRTFTEKRDWQKYAWILERKFQEWNLRSISENKTDLTINYTPPDYMRVLEAEGVIIDG